ncbi:MAG: hypothetical protein CL801_11035 [Citromicrobium sp.]|nr:hypothetical protein [Citromicrobium sp.]
MILKIFSIIGRYLLWLALGLAIFAVGDLLIGDEILQRSSVVIVLGITTGFALSEFIRYRRRASKKGLAS